MTKRNSPEQVTRNGRISVTNDKRTESSMKNVDFPHLGCEAKLKSSPRTQESSPMDTWRGVYANCATKVKIFLIETNN